MWWMLEIKQIEYGQNQQVIQDLLVDVLVVEVVDVVVVPEMD